MRRTHDCSSDALQCLVPGTAYTLTHCPCPATTFVVLCLLLGVHSTCRLEITYTHAALCTLHHTAAMPGAAACSSMKGCAALHSNHTVLAVLLAQWCAPDGAGAQALDESQ